MLPPVGLARAPLTFCCCLYAAKRSIFLASKVLLRARVGMSLALTFSSCQGARAGPRAPEQRGGRLLCALSVFSEGENWLKGCQRTWKHTSIRAHTHTCGKKQILLSALGCTAGKNRVFEMVWWKKKKRTRTHTRAALITRVFLPVFVVLGLQKHEGGEQSPRSNTMELGLRT